MARVEGFPYSKCTYEFRLRIPEPSLLHRAMELVWPPHLMKRHRQTLLPFLDAAEP